MVRFRETLAIIITYFIPRDPWSPEIVAGNEGDVFYQQKEKQALMQITLSCKQTNMEAVERAAVCFALVLWHLTRH